MSAPPPTNDLDHLPTVHPEEGAVVPPVHSGEADDLDYAPTLRGLRAGLKVFDRYELVRMLGRGGMGVVWLARDGKLDLEMALKFLPENLVHDEVALDDLRRETRRCLKLTHQNIVHVFDLVDDGATAAIAMEFVDGKTLSSLRLEKANRVFDVAEITPWLRQTCAALQYAHESAKIVHHDLKPGNLMLTSEGQIKVMDFGISSNISDSMSRVSKASQEQRSGGGTLPYMSPQQIMGYPPHVSDDVYSLGATLYELLTGQPPFFRGEIMRQIEKIKPPAMTERRRELIVENAAPLPAHWESVVAACLEKEAQKRPGSVREAMEQLLAAPAVAATPPAIRVTEAESATATPPTATKKPRSMAGTLVLLAAVVLVGALNWIQQPTYEAPDAEELQKQALEKSTAEIAELVKAGISAFHLNDLPKARLNLEDALALDPGQLEARNMLERIRTAEESRMRDQQYSAELAARKEELLRKGNEALQNQDLPEARRLLESVLSLDANNPSALNAMRALIAMEKAAAQIPTQPPKSQPSPPVAYTPPPPVSPQLPASGYFTMDQIFDGTRYDGYNDYSRSLILTKVQEKLKAAGLYKSSSDGDMGPGTQQAIIAYQRQNGLQVTGKLDTASQKSLNLTDMKESAQPKPRPAPQQNPTVKTKTPAPAKPILTGRQALEENYRRGFIGEKAYRQKLAEMELFNH